MEGEKEGHHRGTAHGPRTRRTARRTGHVVMLFSMMKTDALMLARSPARSLVPPLSPGLAFGRRLFLHLAGGLGRDGGMKAE